ncbi:hypothetical protein IVB45_05265 [Bradyrhizobium sp. 4]|uniref:hypothetical protein n=1 Tax=unclassified Bradyrhizobium TaxID=2631580 RepID=UPI001FF83CE9|nr:MULTISPECIES: hypothetical protein [unclassified Bradyrhizobium]MCK1396995.1 hypothetical protein [Bradyrhizobium sp. 39]MCK1520122.1 hypothetical protein [Bradyrhizobium sp. 17]MCK1632629.1 hypothetical protein [Bradyrhizobium sp. 162]MCK1752271.1 hypothetical protein [Bradyrhizobium sp. 135]UPJ36369.1 hypothetical protein IVB45_05265 [Bradyrhizobium sp. 4]
MTSAQPVGPDIAAIAATRRQARILTVNSNAADHEMLGVSEVQQARNVIGEIEGDLLARRKSTGPLTTKAADIGADVLASFSRLREAHRGIAAILFNCTPFRVCRRDLSFHQVCLFTTSTLSAR